MTTPHDDEQLTLPGTDFVSAACPVSTGRRLDAELRATVAAVLRRSRWSREQLADALSVQLGWRVPAATVANWLAPSHPHRLPAVAIPPLIRLLQDPSVLAVLAADAGYRLVPAGDAPVLDLLELDRREAEIRVARRALRRQLFGARRRPPHTPR